MKLHDALSRAGNFRRVGGGYRIRCPAHNGRDFNCAVWATEDGEARFTCWSHGCDWRTIRYALAGEPVWRLPADLAARPRIDEEKLIECARMMWRESRPALRTPVEVYLCTRGITIPPPATLRYHPWLKHPSGVFVPRAGGSGGAG